MRSQKFNVWKALTLVTSLSVFIIAGVLIYQNYDKGEVSEIPSIEQEANESPTQAATADVLALFGEYPDRQNMFICQYRILATEELQRPVKFGNFEEKYITDRYHQDKPFITPIPGSDISGIDFLKIVPPQEEGAKVVAIRSVERIRGTCKKYDFEPEDPQEDVDPN